MRIIEVVSLFCFVFLGIASSQSDFQCVGNGRYPAGDANCQKYYFCYWNGNGYQKMTLTCPGTTQFNPSRQLCVRPNTFTCSSATATSARTTAQGAASIATTARTTATTRRSTTTTVSVNADYDCVKGGRFPVGDADCQWYYFCFWNANGYTAWRLKCPNATLFNPARELCVAPDSYSCNAATTNATTTEGQETTTIDTTTSDG